MATGLGFSMKVIGMMEYWKVGFDTIQEEDLPLQHNPIFPTFHYSNIPLIVYLCSMILLDCTASSCTYSCFSVHSILQLLISAFFAILFLQSGLDKVSDRNGNIDFMRGHFAKSPMKNMVPAMLFIMTIIELAAGTLSLVGIIVLLIKDCDYWMFWGNLMAAKALLLLFLGQRIAKDYAGAQSLVSYFIVSLIGIWLCA